MKFDYSLNFFKLKKFFNEETRFLQHFTSFIAIYNHSDLTLDIANFQISQLKNQQCIFNGVAKDNTQNFAEIGKNFYFM